MLVKMDCANASGLNPELELIYVNPNTSGATTEQILTHTPNGIFLLLNSYNGVNGSYLSNVHVYTKQSENDTYVEWTNWKSVDFTPCVGKSSTGNYTSGYSCFLHKFNSNETPTLKQGTYVKLTCSSSASVGIGIIY